MLYVFNSKMTLLLRIAETRYGADRLIEFGIIDALTDCQYIDQIPTAETNSKPSHLS